MAEIRGFQRVKKAFKRIFRRKKGPKNADSEAEAIKQPEQETVAGAADGGTAVTTDAYPSEPAARSPIMIRFADPVKPSEEPAAADAPIASAQVPAEAKAEPQA